MKYINPWADAQNFIDLGSYTLESGKVVDLYAIKCEYSKERYSIGVRYSDGPSDYGSGSSVTFYRGIWITHKTICEGASVAISRLINQVIKKPVYDEHYTNKLLFDASGAIQYDLKAHQKAIRDYSIKAGYLTAQCFKVR